MYTATKPIKPRKSLFFSFKTQYTVTTCVPRLVTCTFVNFMATNLKPFCSNRLAISATKPRLTASGLIIMKVLSSMIVNRTDVSLTDRAQIKIDEDG